MNRRRVLSSLLALMVGVVLTGCGSDSGSVGTGSGTRVRLVHAASFANNVDVLIDGVSVQKNLAFRASSGYLSLTPGLHQITVNQTGTTPAVNLTSGSIFLTGNTDFTYILIGRSDNGTLRGDLLQDNNLQPPSNSYRLRFIHASVAGPTVADAYITTPGASLSGIGPNTSLTYGNATNYLSLTTSPVEVRITPSGLNSVQVDTGSVTYNGGQVRTLILVDSSGGQTPLSLITLNDVN